nr:MAG TPA: hypothetical protein [Bacteriophage sp.]
MVLIVLRKSLPVFTIKIILTYLSSPIIFRLFSL